MAQKKATTKKASTKKKAAVAKPVTPPVKPSLGKPRATPAEILSEMTPAAQQLAKEMAGQLEKTNSASVKTYYDVGDKLNRSHKAEKTYGGNFVGQFSEYAGIDTGQLYGYKQMAEELKWEDVEATLKAAKAKHVPVFVGHFVAIAQIADPKTRKALLSEVVEKRLSVNAIQARVSASGEQTTQRAAGAGRKQSPPQTPQVGLKEAAKRADNLKTYLEFFESDVYTKLDEIPPGSVTKNDYELMQNLQEKLTELQTEIDASLELFAPRFERIENIRTRQEQEEDGVEVEEEEEAEDPLVAEDEEDITIAEYQKRQRAAEQAGKPKKRARVRAAQTVEA